MVVKLESVVFNTELDTFRCEHVTIAGVQNKSTTTDQFTMQQAHLQLRLIKHLDSKHTSMMLTVDKVAKTYVFFDSSGLCHCSGIDSITNMRWTFIHI